MVADAGEQAAQRSLAFFDATIRNANTHMVSYWTVLQFFAWCDQHHLGQRVEIGRLEY
jgi:hypothetical protein